MKKWREREKGGDREKKSDNNNDGEKYGYRERQEEAIMWDRRKKSPW